MLGQSLLRAMRTCRRFNPRFITLRNSSTLAWRSTACFRHSVAPRPLHWRHIGRGHASSAAAATAAAHKTPTYRKDYLPPSHLIETVDLHFDFPSNPESGVTVRSKLTCGCNFWGQKDRVVRLDGSKDIQLDWVKLDGKTLQGQEYSLREDGGLDVRGVPVDREFTLETQVRVSPHTNTSLMGLFKSNQKTFVTQCEAEGFRKITYFIDRPDVMAKYRVRLEADKIACPVLLSNGNLVESGDLEGGQRHFAQWEDPHRKPSYLFAVVAGDLASCESAFTTRSGREVQLQVLVEPSDLDQTKHAMDSLINSMQWDETRFGLEYDLDRYMIVAVSDFNMGAMENKGLNVFNTKYVLGRHDTATDDDLEGIESVIGHEYFHNWTGNRVTCRDWFQLSLKEGLTVYRDQEFTGDQTQSHAAKRIEDVRVLRAFQFPEDAGPMKHPVRPESYLEMNNFYTATVYNKGAEVVRMYQTLFGDAGFRKGMDVYFERFDGQAVTCDDFRHAMADANGVSDGLKQFERWYTQEGTPTLEVAGEYDAAEQTYTLTLSQKSAVEGQKPFHLPVSVGLVGKESGADLSISVRGEEGEKQLAAGEGDAVTRITRVLELKEGAKQFVFEGVCEEPVPSVLRGFSAPVNVRYLGSLGDGQAARCPSHLRFLMTRDSCEFNRWEAGQQFFASFLLQGATGDSPSSSSMRIEDLVTAFRQTLLDANLNPRIKALSLTLPSSAYLAEKLPAGTVDPHALHAARKAIRQRVARDLKEELLAVYRANCDDAAECSSPANVGKRKMRNTALSYLVATEDADAVELAQTQFQQALGENMTNTTAALAALADSQLAHQNGAREQAFRAYEAHFAGNALCIDKSFAMQAGSDIPDLVFHVKALMARPDFSIKNPNRARSVLGSFAHNYAAFHHEEGSGGDGEGYTLLCDAVVEADALNPQLAAQLVTPLLRWPRYKAESQRLMKAQLQRLLTSDSLSDDVYEKVSKALDQ